MTTHIPVTGQNVKKHVAAIHISNKLSFLERKMSNVMLWNAYEELLTRKIHRIKVQELAEIIGFDSNDRQVLKAALKSLLATVLEWNIIDDHGRERDWEACTLLEYARMQGGYCYYSYSEPLRQKLYQPEVYERINLSIQRRFSSGYTLALYENCLRFRKTGCTGWIPLPIFRELMGVNPHEYQDFRRLNTRVIKEPVAQVNDTTDITITPEYQREKRRVTAVRFKVKENLQLPLFPNNIQEEQPQKSEQPLFESAPLTKRLADFGLSSEQINALLADHPADYIEGNLQIVAHDYQAGKVENLPAYTIAALKQDYRHKEAPLAAAQRKAKLEQKAVELSKKQALIEKEAQKQEQETERLQDALMSLTTADRSALETRFQNAYQNHPSYQKWGKEGMNNAVIKSLFLAFARRELLHQEYL